jgi:hypothetical protein
MDDREELGPVLAPDVSGIARIDGGGVIHVSPGVLGDAFRPFPGSAGVAKRHGLLRFSPDGRRLVTCDDAGHAHVWEVASGQLAFTLTYPDGAIHDVRFGRDGRTLITSNHREVIVWDLLLLGEPVADPWAQLKEAAPRAEMARRALLADPAGAVELIRRQLRPAAPVDAAAVGRLLTELDGPDYRGRERAAAGLRAVGRRVLPALRQAKLESVEGSSRLAALAKELSAGPTPEELRQIRSVEVLEQIDSPAARGLIEELAAGDPGAVLTEEANKARGRRIP